MFDINKGWKRVSKSVRERLARDWTKSVQAPTGVVEVADYSYQPLSFFPDLLLFRAELGEVHCFGAYALAEPDGSDPVMLGSSDEIHVARLRRKFVLNDDTVCDYLHFFCLMVTAQEGPFRIIDRFSHFNITRPPRGTNKLSDAGIMQFDQVAAEEFKNLPRPLKIKTTDEGWDIEALIQYGAELYVAQFRVGKDGLVSMVDDMPLMTGLAISADQNRMAKPEKTTEEKPGRTTKKKSPKRSSQSTLFGIQSRVIKTFYGCLIAESVRRQSLGPLLDIESTSKSAKDDETVLNHLARTLKQAGAIVIIESETALIEEMVLDVLAATNGIGGERKRPVWSGRDGVDLEVKEANMTLVVSLHEGRTILFPDEIVFEFSRLGLPVLIGCPDRRKVPRELREASQCVLRIPPLSEKTFGQVFAKLMETPVPNDALEDGGWIRYVTPDDFFDVKRDRLAASGQIKRGPGLAEGDSWDARVAVSRIRERVRARLKARTAANAPPLDEIHGMGEARQIARDLVEEIHAALNGKLEWNQLDRGMLVVGEPGTGKTMLARSIAAECGVRFIASSAATWIAGTEHLGQHLANIQALFAEARRYQPVILFIDELDSIGTRSRFSGRNRHYATQVVNALLGELQGLSERGHVFVIGATNHLDNVDPALRRPGRLDHVVNIPRPTRRALARMLEYYLAPYMEKDLADKAIDHEEVAGLALGDTGADIKRYVRLAWRRARQKGRPISHADLVAAISGTSHRHDEDRPVDLESLEKTAIHEAGHAVQAATSAGGRWQPGIVSVVSGRGAAGFVRLRPTSEAPLTRSQCRERLSVLLAGRAAEAIAHGEDRVSSGAGGSEASDLAKATQLAVAMVQQLGMGQTDALYWEAGLPSGARLEQVRSLLDEAYADARDNLESHWSLVENLAAVLVDRQEISGPRLDALLRPGQGQ